jgi:hypothetical protein
MQHDYGRQHRLHVFYYWEQGKDKTQTMDNGKVPSGGSNAA